MEILEQRIQHWLFNFYSPERFGFLRVLGKTWEKEMKEKSKIPCEIEIVLPPNFFGTTITLLKNNRFEVKNIGINFSAVLKEPENKNADEKGLVYKFGRCLGTIIGEYLYSDSLMSIISTTPVEFNYEKMPEWIDKGNYFDINSWINYYQRYVFNLSILIMKWFDVTVKTSQEWIEDRSVPKAFQEKKNTFDQKYRRAYNIAEKMFRKTNHSNYFRRRIMVAGKKTIDEAIELFYKDMIDTLTDKLLLSEINDIAYTVMQTEIIIIPGKFLDGIIHLEQKIKKALWPRENKSLEASICSSVIYAVNFYHLFGKRSRPLENDFDSTKMNFAFY
jgi:hypothetical protein